MKFIETFCSSFKTLMYFNWIFLAYRCISAEFIDREKPKPAQALVGVWISGAKTGRAIACNAIWPNLAYSELAWAKLCWRWLANWFVFIVEPKWAVFGVFDHIFEGSFKF